MDDLSDILSRVFDFAASNLWIIIVVFGLLASGRRNRRNKGSSMSLPTTNTPSRTQSKQTAQSLFPIAPAESMVMTPTSITTVTPPAVIEDRPDDLMKDLVKRVG